MEQTRKSADRVERKVVGPGTGVGPQDGSGKIPSVRSLKQAYEQSVLPEVDKVMSVFGASDVSRQADAAAVAVRDRLEALGEIEFQRLLERMNAPVPSDDPYDDLFRGMSRRWQRRLSRLRRSEDSTVGLLPQLRATELERINEFRLTAASALRLAADEVDRLNTDQAKLVPRTSWTWSST
jgi:hypothetical protein